MNVFNRLSLTARITAVFIVIAILPALAIGLFSLHSARAGEELAIKELETLADATMDKIERNLFERYGDVQAFGLNKAVLDKSNWYRVGSISNAVAEAANSYVRLYGIYALSMAVDTEGRVIAVNDQNAAGKPVETAYLYKRNFAGETWFKKAMAGEFLKSDILDGTYVDDAGFSEDVQQLTGGVGLNVAFAAPFKDKSGKVLGVWMNRAAFDVVEEIVSSGYKTLAAKGTTTAELTLIDRAGRVLVDYDPSANGGDLAVRHNPSVILNLNLAKDGVTAAQNLVEGKSGHAISVHSRKGVRQATGFARSAGALGYPGLGWGLMLRVNTDQAFAASSRLKWILGATMVLAFAGISLVAILLGRSLAKPILLGVEELHRLGESVSSSSGEVASASQSIADAASQQAAAIEETSASITELASMTEKSSEQSDTAKASSDKTRATASSGIDDVRSMGQAIEQIRKAGEEVCQAIADIQASGNEVSRIIRTIDEIAFQTNILALNAAVEAARAGEAGAGFAVVADEVRNLAQRSARAAKETSELIDNSIRKSDTGAQVSRRLEESLKAVEQSAKQVQNRLTEIATQTTDVDKSMAEIAAAARDQSDGLKQITQAVSSMDEITQGNAAGAEECATAANELRNYAADVWASVERMRSVVAGSASTAKARPSDGSPSPSRPQPAKNSVAKPASSHHSQAPSSKPATHLDLDSHPRTPVTTVGPGEQDLAEFPLDGMKKSSAQLDRPRANPSDFRDF